MKTSSKDRRGIIKVKKHHKVHMKDHSIDASLSLTSPPPHSRRQGTLENPEEGGGSSNCRVYCGSRGVDQV